MNNHYREGFRGYTSHVEFGGNRIPVPIQNLVMRDYASRRNLLFKLSVNEFNFPNCYIQLTNTLSQLDTLEGVLMCSLFMLPPERNKRVPIYETVIRQGAELHFILENAILKKPQDINYVENLFKLSETLAACPASIPEHLLPELKAAYFTG